MSDTLNEEEVFEVLKWARQIYSNGIYGVYSPTLSNRNLVELNNKNRVPTRASLNNALKSEVPDAKLLQQFSEFAESYDRIFSRTIDYYEGLLAFDLNIVCKNAYHGKGDYSSQEYKDDLHRVYKFLDNFDYKAEFRKVVKQILRKEIYYTWFRDSEGTFDETGEINLNDDGNVKAKKRSKYTLQVMPQDYCILTGAWEYGLLYDFDMNYFTKPGVSLDSYDPIFRKYHRRTFNEDESIYEYNPTSQLKKRNGIYASWVQTSPEDGAWVFKLDMSNYNSVPFLTPLIRDVLTDEEIANLQRDANILAAHGIIVGEIPRLEKQKSGEVQDAMAWKMETLMKFMRLVKAGLEQNVNAVAMPTTDSKFYQFDAKDTKDMYGTQLSNTAGNAASASRIIYTSDKVGQFELQAQIQSDYNFIKKVYSQFEQFLNFYVNKKTRKYKFNFIFSGSNYNFIRDKEKQNLLDLANLGIVLNIGAYAKIVNMRPHDFERALDEGHNSDLTDKLTMLLNVHTQGNENNKNGRPELDISERSESSNQNYE